MYVTLATVIMEMGWHFRAYEIVRHNAYSMMMVQFHLILDLMRRPPIFEILI